MARPPSRPAPNSVTSRARRVALIALSWVACAGLVGCDHATKEAACDLANKPARSLVSGVLELRYAENHDTAFSLLRGAHVPHKETLLLALSGAALVAVLAAWLWRMPRATLVEHAGFAMVLAGAVGNVADRATRGFVVDFIHVEHWPVFNVADITVVAGVALLAISTRLTRPAAPHGPRT